MRHALLIDALDMLAGQDEDQQTDVEQHDENEGEYAVAGREQTADVSKGRTQTDHGDLHKAPGAGTVLRIEAEVGQGVHVGGEDGVAAGVAQNVQHQRAPGADGSTVHAAGGEDQQQLTGNEQQKTDDERGLEGQTVDLGLPDEHEHQHDRGADHREDGDERLGDAKVLNDVKREEGT